MKNKLVGKNKINRSKLNVLCLLGMMIFGPVGVENKVSLVKMSDVSYVNDFAVMNADGFMMQREESCLVTPIKQNVFDNNVESELLKLEFTDYKKMSGVLKSEKGQELYGVSQIIIDSNELLIKLSDDLVVLRVKAIGEDKFEANLICESKEYLEFCKNESNDYGYEASDCGDSKECLNELNAVNGTNYIFVVSRKGESCELIYRSQLVAPFDSQAIMELIDLMDCSTDLAMLEQDIFQNVQAVNDGDAFVGGMNVCNGEITNELLLELLFTSQAFEKLLDKILVTSEINKTSLVSYNDLVKKFCKEKNKEHLFTAHEYLVYSAPTGTPLDKRLLNSMKSENDASRKGVLKEKYDAVIFHADGTVEENEMNDMADKTVLSEFRFGDEDGDLSNNGNAMSDADEGDFDVVVKALRRSRVSMWLDEEVH